MALDLSLPALVNSGGGLLFAAVGAFALAVGGRTREDRLIAALAIAFGLTYVVTNLWPFGTPGFPAAAGVVLSALVGLLAIALGVHLTRALPPRLRRAALGLGLVLLASTAAFLSYGASRVPDLARAGGVGPDEAKLVALGVAGFAASTGALAFMVTVSAFVMQATPREDAPRRRALALHACAYALFAVFTTSGVWPVFPELNALLLAAVVPAATWAFASRDALGRNVTLALVAAGLAGVTLSLAQLVYALPPGTDFGSPGILRAIGAFLLALAILRHGLVGQRADGRAVRQGPLAFGALVTLFVVAQVAQNFLSAHYGLIMGGVVAGALLVAARPIERALEKRDASADADKLDVYREAARRSLRDGVVTRAEEIHLARLARHLAIPHDVALRIRHEVEDERGAGGETWRST